MCLKKKSVFDSPSTDDGALLYPVCYLNNILFVLFGIYSSTSGVFKYTYPRSFDLHKTNKEICSMLDVESKNTRGYHWIMCKVYCSKYSKYVHFQYVIENWGEM